MEPNNVAATAQQQRPRMSDYFIFSGSTPGPDLQATPVMQPIASGSTLPETVRTDPSKECLLKIIADHRRARPFTHVQTLSMGIICGYTLAEESKEKAKQQKEAEVAGRVAGRQSEAEEAAAQGGTVHASDTIDPFIVGGIARCETLVILLIIPCPLSKPLPLHGLDHAACGITALLRQPYQHA